MDTLIRTCPSCGTRFGQPNDPGRKRTYCSNACRQQTYRDRTKAKADDFKRRQEQARQKAYDDMYDQDKKSRSRRKAEYGTPADWWSPRMTDTAAQAKARATCARLMERAEHLRTNSHEAAACRAKADELRIKKGL